MMRSQIKTPEDGAICLVQEIFVRAKKDFHAEYRGFVRAKSQKWRKNHAVELHKIYLFFRSMGGASQQAFRELLKECESKYGVLNEKNKIFAKVLDIEFCL